MFAFIKNWFAKRQARRERERCHREYCAKFEAYVRHLHTNDPQTLGKYYEDLMNAKAGEIVRLGPFQSRVLGNYTLK